MAAPLGGGGARKENWGFNDNEGLSISDTVYLHQYSYSSVFVCYVFFVFLFFCFLCFFFGGGGCRGSHLGFGLAQLVVYGMLLEEVLEYNVIVGSLGVIGMPRSAGSKNFHFKKFPRGGLLVSLMEDLMRFSYKRKVIRICERG